MRAGLYWTVAAIAATLVALTGSARAVCPSPTHSLTVTKIGSASGSQPYRATDGPFWQHIVSTPNGIFAAFKYSAGISGGNTATTGYWKLMRSTDGGTTWTTVYTDSATNTGQVENISVDADSTGNVYVVASTHQGSSWANSPTFFYRFPAGNYSSHTLTKLTFNGAPIGAASKTTSMFNAENGMVDVMEMGQASNTPQFFEVNPSTGAVTVAKQLWKGQSSQPNSTVAEYPELAPGPGGQTFAGWFTTDNGLLAGTQNYYDAAFAESPDGGSTWFGPGGQLTLPINDTNTGPAYEIVNTADPAEFLPYTNSGYKSGGGNYNVLDSFAYNNGALHFFFQGPQPQNHASYARLAWPGSTFSNRTDAFGTSDGNLIPAQSDGAFTQTSSSLTGSLYFLGSTSAGSGIRRLIAMNTLDGGASWCTFATSSWTGSTSNIRYIGVSRVTDASGHVLGLFTYITGSSSANVYFVKSG